MIERKNVAMKKNASKYYHESNTAFSPAGNNDNLICSKNVNNYLNSSRMEVWFI